MFHKINKIYILGVFLGLAVFGMIFLKKGSILVFGGGNLDFFAKKILLVCSKDNYRRGCYDKEIPKILEKGFVTMEEAFAVTNKIQTADRSYLYCHILGHNLADIETRKDLGKWLDVIARCPPVACNNGCEHGAVMRRFKGSDVLSDNQLAVLAPDLKNACEPRGNWKPSELEISMCYHSLGHLAMYITDANVNKSLAICKQIAVKPDGRNYYQTCVQGVFMIIFQSLDTDDVALVSKIKPTKESVADFCAKYSGMEFVSCKVESWPYFSQDLKTPQGLINFCSFAKTQYDRWWCYDDDGLRGGYPIEILQASGVEGVAKYCMSFPDDIKGRCFPSISTAWVQDEPNYIKDSIALCKEAGKYGFSDKCYKGLLFFSKFSFNRGTSMWKDYCNNFLGKYKEDCFSGNVPDSW